jgi:hypothetical protein
MPIRLLLFVRLAGIAALAALPAHAAPVCPNLPGVRPAPPELAPRIAVVFAIAPETAANSVIRCNGRRVLACTSGANLNCGKADTRRVLPGANDYCRAHPSSSFIPMFATGHATIYDWRCSGGRAIPGDIVAPPDPQGYTAANWREVR